MGTLIPGILALIEQLLPALGASSATGVLIEKIVTVLIDVTPVVIQEYNDLLPVVKNIISALNDNASTTADQLATLKILDKQADDAFEAAASDAEAEDTK